MATTFGLILSKKFLIKKRGFISIATSSESERTQPKFPYRSESILLRLFLMLLFTELFRGTEQRTIRSVQDLYRLSYMAWDKARSWSPPFETCLSERNIMMRQRERTNESLLCSSFYCLSSINYFSESYVASFKSINNY